jgi:hypothetical protein
MSAAVTAGSMKHALNAVEAAESRRPVAGARVQGEAGPRMLPKKIIVGTAAELERKAAHAEAAEGAEAKGQRAVFAEVPAKTRVPPMTTLIMINMMTRTMTTTMMMMMMMMMVTGAD